MHLDIKMIQNGGIYANVAIKFGCIAILECIYQLAAMYIVFPLSFRPRAEFPVLSQYRYNILYTTSGFSA